MLPNHINLAAASRCLISARIRKTSIYMILSDQQFMNSSVSIGMCTPKDSHQAAVDCQRQRATVDSFSTNEKHKEVKNEE